MGPWSRVVGHPATLLLTFVGMQLAQLVPGSVVIVFCGDEMFGYVNRSIDSLYLHRLFLLKLIDKIMWALYLGNLPNTV